MKKIINSFLLLMMLTIVSCIDKDFDEPPIGGIDPPGLKANTTIAQLKAIFGGAGTVKAVPDSMIVAGLVNSSDETGNFYKELVIQDSTGGILIRLDRSSTYTLMPVGRRIFVKCAGLYISDYGTMIQVGVLGNNAVDRIPDLLIDEHLVRGQWGQTVPVKVTQNINSLDNYADQNILVRIDSVHFDSTVVCFPWSDAGGTTNRRLLDKNNKEIQVRTSNYANFAAEYLPGGTGSIVGVFEIFGTTKQFKIRGLKDVVNFPPGDCASLHTPVHTIAALRALYTGTNLIIPAGSDIEGVVISDKSNLNITTNNIILQDATGGVMVRFKTANIFTVGQKIRVNISNRSFIDYFKVLEVDAVDISLATVTGTGTITPRNATIADIKINGEDWESTLVKIQNVKMSGPSPNYISGSNYNISMSDNPGDTLTLYTRSSAIFSGTAYPTTTVSVTGIIGDNTTGRQMSIRSTADVTP